MNFYAGADVIPETLEKDHRAGKVTSIPIALPMAPWSKGEQSLLLHVSHRQRPMTGSLTLQTRCGGEQGEWRGPLLRLMLATADPSREIMISSTRAIPEVSCLASQLKSLPCLIEDERLTVTGATNHDTGCLRDIIGAV